jgi:hypothetical protein
VDEEGKFSGQVKLLSGAYKSVKIRFASESIGRGAILVTRTDANQVSKAEGSELAGDHSLWRGKPVSETQTRFSSSRYVFPSKSRSAWTHVSGRPRGFLPRSDRERRSESSVRGFAVSTPTSKRFRQHVVGRHTVAPLVARQVGKKNNAAQVLSRKVALPGA